MPHRHPTRAPWAAIAVLALGLLPLMAPAADAPAPDPAGDAALKALGYIEPPKPTLRESLGITDPSPLVGKPTPPLVVGDWLYGEPIAAFDPTATYALCVLSVLELEDLLSRFAEERHPIASTIPWIVVVTEEQPFRLPAGNSPERRAKMREFMLPRIQAKQAIMERLRMHVAWDDPTGAMRAAFPGIPGRQTAAAIIHRGQVWWFGQGLAERPVLSLVCQQAGQKSSNLTWLRERIATAQQRALPLVELATRIATRGYPEAGEWDQLTILSQQFERADLGLGYAHLTGIGFLDDVMRGGTLDNGMFTSQVYLWSMIRKLTRRAYEPARGLTQDQQEAVLAVMRRLATPEEYEHEVGRARSKAVFAELLKLVKQGAPEDRLAAKARELVELGDPAILFIDGESVAKEAGRRELARGILDGGLRKMGGKMNPYLVGLAVEGLVAVGDRAAAKRLLDEAKRLLPDATFSDADQALSTAP